MFSRLKPHLVPLVLLLAATFAVYAQSLGHEFLADWDDPKYVTANEAVRGFTLEHMKAAFSKYYVGNYAPLQIISYMLDYSLWGLRAAGFIFTNILVHALNGILYYALLIRLTGRRIWAFAVSFIFLLHPAQVESVAWISQRKNVLAMFFFLISLLFYIAYRGSGFVTRDPQKLNQNSKFIIHNSKLLYAGSIAAFIAALLAKSVAVVLPLVLVLYDLCFLESEKRKRWIVDKVPYIVAASVVAFVAMKSQAPEFDGGKTGFHGGSPLATFLTMLPVFARYLGMLFWPAELSAAYNPPIKTGVDGAVVLSALLLAALIAGGFYLYRRRKELFFWGALFFVGLLPVAQIVPLITLMNDRYLYFPLLGGAAFVAGAAATGMNALTGTTRKAVAAILCLALLALPLLSFERAQVWQNSLTLWTDAYGKVPDSAVICCALGSAYRRAGNLDAALPLYQKALSLDPMDRNSLNNIGVIHMLKGEYDKAKPHLIRLTNNYGKFAEGFLNLGICQLMTDNLQEAEVSLRRSLLLQPRSGMALRNLGTVYFKQSRSELAREYYLQALAAGDESAEMRCNLASLEAARGRTDGALEHLEAAFELGYKDFETLLHDQRLASLHTLPEFGHLLAKYMKSRP